MGEVEEERDPHSGAIVLRRTGVQAPDERNEFTSFQGTANEENPASYYLWAETDRTVVDSMSDRWNRLETRGITTRELTEPLAHMAFTLLKPRADDAFVARGFLTDVIRAGEVHPVPHASPGGSPSTHATPRDPS